MNYFKGVSALRISYLVSLHLMISCPVFCRGARGGPRGRGGRGGRWQKEPVPDKDALDKELDVYMSGSRAHLDKELDNYMSEKWE